MSAGYSSVLADKTHLDYQIRVGWIFFISLVKKYSPHKKENGKSFFSHIEDCEPEIITTSDEDLFLSKNGAISL